MPTDELAAVVEGYARTRDGGGVGGLAPDRPQLRVAGEGLVSLGNAGDVVEAAHVHERGHAPEPVRDVREGDALEGGVDLDGGDLLPDGVPGHVRVFGVACGRHHPGFLHVPVSRCHLGTVEVVELEEPALVVD